MLVDDADFAFYENYFVAFGLNYRYVAAFGNFGP